MKILNIEEKINKRSYVDLYEKKTNERSEFLPELTEANLKILINSMSVRVQYNEITKEAISDTEILDKGNSEETYEQILISMIEDELMRDNFKSRSVATLMRKLDVIAFRDSFNPVRDYLKNNYKKNKFKIDNNYNEFNKLFNTLTIDEDDIPMSKMLLKKWLISCVASQMEEYFESHGVLIFSGDQGMGKTTFFKTLIPDEVKKGSPQGKGYFKESFQLDVSNKDHQIQYIRNWIVELGEVGSTLKKEMDMLKAFLTSGSDTIRVPFGKKAVTSLRRTVPAGTVDTLEFLRDDTNRRFWVIELKNINLEALRNINIDLLWSEIFDMYSNGEKWYLEKIEISDLNKQNTRYRLKNEVESFIESAFDWDNENKYYVDVSELYTIISRQLKNVTNSKIGKALKRMNIPNIEKRGRKKFYAFPKPKKEYDVCRKDWNDKFDKVISNYNKKERDGIKNENK